MVGVALLSKAAKTLKWCLMSYSVGLNYLLKHSVMEHSIATVDVDITAFKEQAWRQSNLPNIYGWRSLNVGLSTQRSWSKRSSSKMYISIYTGKCASDGWRSSRYPQKTWHRRQNHLQTVRDTSNVLTVSRRRKKLKAVEIRVQVGDVNPKEDVWWISNNCHLQDPLVTNRAHLPSLTTVKPWQSCQWARYSHPSGRTSSISTT